MTNFQVYRKTLSFSLLMFLVDLLMIAVVAGAATAGFFIAKDINNMAIFGLIIGFILGIIAVALINIFIKNRIKAAQIAMMTIGVNEGILPDHTFKAGFEELRGRFAKITVFFFVTNAIKGIFRQLGRTINRVGTALGGNTGNAITSTIDSAIQTLIGYLCDCCLGWVLFRKEENSARAACEGAVIFFKHGKTLIRNIGRIFGMGFLSFLLIGGAFFGVSYLIFAQFPQMFESLANEVSQIMTSDGGTAPEFLSNPTTFAVFVAAILGIVMWSVIHSVLVRPFILVGVLRNFMAAGKQDIPTEQDFALLDGKSARFAKLHNTI